MANGRTVIERHNFRVEQVLELANCLAMSSGTRVLPVFRLCHPWYTQYVLGLVAEWQPLFRGPEGQEAVSASESLLVCENVSKSQLAYFLWRLVG